MCADCLLIGWLLYLESQPTRTVFVRLKVNVSNIDRVIDYQTKIEDTHNIEYQIKQNILVGSIQVESIPYNKYNNTVAS